MNVEMKRALLNTGLKAKKADSKQKANSRNTSTKKQKNQSVISSFEKFIVLYLS
jgi:hypothetical protein